MQFYWLLTGVHLFVCSFPSCAPAAHWLCSPFSVNPGADTAWSLQLRQACLAATNTVSLQCPCVLQFWGSVWLSRPVCRPVMSRQAHSWSGVAGTAAQWVVINLCNDLCMVSHTPSSLSACGDLGGPRAWSPLDWWPGPWHRAPNDKAIMQMCNRSAVGMICIFSRNFRN